MPNPFGDLQAKAWPFWYEASMLVSNICGGVPSSEKTAEAWVRAKLQDTRSDAEVKAVVAQTVEDLRVTNKAAGRTAEGAGIELVKADELAEKPGKVMTAEELTEAAVIQVAKDMAGLNVFKRTEAGILYIEGRQVKAALKEAVSVAANAGKISTKGWGNPDNAAYKKQLKGWFPEHVFIPETTIPLMTADGEMITEPTGTLQKFVHTHRGDAIGYEEYLDQARVVFRVKTDVELTREQWGMIWLTGQDQGLGASRSQGFGVYEMDGWQQVPAPLVGHVEK